MRFKTVRTGFIDTIRPDGEDRAFSETEEEANEYDQRIKEEIKWKLSAQDKTAEADSSPRDDDDLAAAVIPSSETTIQGDEPGAEALTPTIAIEDRPRFSQFPAPSFRLSGFAHSTPKPLTTTTTSTFPQVPTPTFVSTPQLPQPSTSSIRAEAEAGPSKTPKTVETPIHVPSPIDTPYSYRPVSGSGEGRGRRDDPATPVPLGVEKFKLLKGKKDFQTLTKHFEVFSKQTERQKKLVEEAGKGKNKGKSKVVEVATLGGKVFEGLRFCFPPELGNTSKQKTHWDIVSTVPYRVNKRSPVLIDDCRSLKEVVRLRSRLTRPSRTSSMIPDGQHKPSPDSSAYRPCPNFRRGQSAYDTIGSFIVSEP